MPSSITFARWPGTWPSVTVLFLSVLMDRCHSYDWARLFTCRWNTIWRLTLRWPLCPSNRTLFFTRNMLCCPSREVGQQGESPLKFRTKI